jgi:hypothetical protein
MKALLNNRFCIKRQQPCAQFLLFHALLAAITHDEMMSTLTATQNATGKTVK